MAGPTLHFNQNVLFRCVSQAVWSSKYRRRHVLVPMVGARLHVVVQVNPQFGIHGQVKVLKGRSSCLLRQQFPQLRSRPAIWSTNAYFVATADRMSLACIKRYVKNRKHV